MKKISIILSALVFALVLTQCKKEETPATTNDNNNGVMITLSVGNNSRADVNPTGNENWATVSYEVGDSIYVGYNGAFVGCLECKNTSANGYGQFEGFVTIDNVVAGEKLHFYMLGGKGFQPNPASITDNQLTVNLSDQTTKYPVISYATSNEEYVASTTTYTSDRLKNKCSIMKFNVTTPSSAAICITGMNNTVTLNFDPTTTGTDEGFSYSKTGAGVIKMAGGSGSPAEKWAIVLPQASVPMGGAYTEDNAYVGTRPAIDEIGSNQYLSGGVNMSVNTETPLTLEALTDGTIVVNDPQSGMQYSLNGGAKAPVTSDAINVSASDKVQFYGNGTNISNYFGTTIAGGTAQVKVYGNIMSLLDEDNYATPTTLLNQDYVFTGLFSENTKLTDASGLLLPATTLAGGCYANMFAGCTSLTTAPALPATTLTEYCYYGMFQGCTSLTTAPALPAETLASNCYSYMFQGCTSLNTAPALPAETLASDCYYDMFAYCTSLTTAPALPATTLAERCYGRMFENCTSLTTAPALPAETLEGRCYYYMFSGCTSLTTAPALPATTLVDRCYSSMFKGCTSLSSITCLATEGINENQSTTDWVNGVASTGTFNRASGATWPEGANGIPSGWTLVPPADLPAATVTTAPTAKTGVTAGQNEAIVNAGTAEGGTMMYMVNATQPTSTDGFSATVPTAEGLTAGTYYVWYYVKGDASHTDSEISATGIEVTIAAAPDLNLTSPAVGQVIGDDGKNYNYASLPDGVTAVAKICYVSDDHGLALALTDEGQMSWNTAISTCAAHTPAFTGGTWKLATQDEWNNMITAAGSYTDLRDGFSSVGGSNLQSGLYWSSTELDSDSDKAWGYYFNIGSWGSDLKVDVNVWVRACLAF